MHSTVQTGICSSSRMFNYDHHNLNHNHYQYYMNNNLGNNNNNHHHHHNHNHPHHNHLSASQSGSKNSPLSAAATTTTTTTSTTTTGGAYNKQKKADSMLAVNTALLASPTNEDASSTGSSRRLNNKLALSTSNLYNNKYSVFYSGDKKAKPGSANPNSLTNMTQIGDSTAHKPHSMVHLDNRSSYEHQLNMEQDKNSNKSQLSSNNGLTHQQQQQQQQQHPAGSVNMRDLSYSSSCSSQNKLKQFAECSKPCGVLTLVLGVLLMLLFVAGFVFIFNKRACSYTDTCSDPLLKTISTTNLVVGILFTLLGVVIVIYSKVDQTANVIITTATTTTTTTTSTPNATNATSSSSATNKKSSPHQAVDTVDEKSKAALSAGAKAKLQLSKSISDSQVSKGLLANQ